MEARTSRVASYRITICPDKLYDFLVYANLFFHENDKAIHFFKIRKDLTELDYQYLVVRTN